MRVMTFNLRCDFFLDFKNRWDGRKDIVFEIMREYNCDIIGVQELTPIMHRDVKETLKEYNIVGSSRTKKFFKESNDILVKNIYNIENHNTFWLSETPDKVGSAVWYSLFPRICTTALVEVEKGKRVRIYNTHLDVFTPQAREYGLKKLSERIEEEHKREGIPVIVMGDFNATPDSKIIKGFMDKGVNSKRFVAVQEKKRELYECATLSGFKGKKKGLHIDYIFVSEEIEIKDVKIIEHNLDGKYPSDHYPLIADLKINF